MTTAYIADTGVFVRCGDADRVVLLTTDKPAGRAAETLLPDRGFGDCLDYRYASESSLEDLSAADFR